MSQHSLKQDSCTDDKELKVIKKPEDTKINIDLEIAKNFDNKSERQYSKCKGNEHDIVDILTEKNLEPIIEARPRLFWVYNAYRTQAIGETLEYSSDRNSFVRNVFALVFGMLLVTTSFIYCVISLKELRRLMLTKEGLILLIVCMTVVIGINYTLCCSNCSRQFPCNYVILVLGTAAFSYLAGFICSRYAPYIVLGAALTTLAISLLCLMLACTSFDFTKFTLIALVAGFALAFAMAGCAVISMVFHIQLSIVRFVILIASALVSSLTLVIELQMILGGKSVELGEDEYVLGAYMVYTSIIDLFLKLLSIINTIMDLDDIL